MINDEDYWACMDTCQRIIVELAALKGLLFDEEGLEGDTLAGRVRELLEIKFKYDDLCQ